MLCFHYENDLRDTYQRVAPDQAVDTLALTKVAELSASVSCTVELATAVSGVPIE